MNWDYLRKVHPELLDGLLVTLQATALGMVLATVLGLLMAIVQVLRIPVARQVVAVWILVIRNTPLLAQLFFLFYVLPRYGLLLDGVAVGTVGLGVHFSCYTSEAFRGGFLAVPRGQWEASHMLHLPRRTTLRRVVVPQAVRPIVPALGNSLISMFKDSSVLAAIAVMELLGTTRRLASTSFQYTTLFTAVGVIYLVVALPASLAVRALERRLAAGSTGMRAVR